MVTPKKKYGQHFLRDENTARKIIGYINHDFPAILEIGPGTGVLSKYLLEDPALDPFFLEVDEESVDYLHHALPAIAGRLLKGDFLEFDLAGFRPGNEQFTVIGNFPYNISSQILFRVLEFRDRVPEVIGMFQREVALRIAAPPGSKTYGILSVLLQAFYHIDYLFTVSESVFHPPPKVKSAVIRLRRNETLRLDCDEPLFTRIVKCAFNQRRKTLRNSLRSMVDEEILTRLELVSERPEQLSVDDFVRITRAVEECRASGPC
jgi:16S rRNA (adenine1518-N6/adenine1519-N6)-dimethyltransferase